MFIKLKSLKINVMLSKSKHAGFSPSDKLGIAELEIYKIFGTGKVLLKIVNLRQVVQVYNSKFKLSFQNL